MDDDNNELIIYVLQQLRYGVPEASIRATLAQNGWPQPLIDRAFSMVQQAAPHNVPPTDYNSQDQQAYANPVAADLPAPADNPFSVVDEVKQEENQEKRNKILRSILIALLILILLAGATFAGILIYKAVKEHSHKAAQTTSEQPKTNPDDKRKKDLEALASKLTAYYAAKNTYPTMDQVNNEAFAKSKNGFDVDKYRNPDWDAKKSKCVDKGRAILATGRVESCYGYRATAMNGSDCDANGTKCTRIVLTANLSGNKPYIIALDQNVRE